MAGDFLRLLKHQGEEGAILTEVEVHLGQKQLVDHPESEDSGISGNLPLSQVWETSCPRVQLRRQNKPHPADWTGKAEEPCSWVLGRS